MFCLCVTSSKNLGEYSTSIYIYNSYKVESYLSESYFHFMLCYRISSEAFVKKAIIYEYTIVNRSISKGKNKTSRMLGSIVLHLCRSSLGGSIIFICPDHFVGLFVLWSNWRLRVHVLGHFAKTIDLRGHMPRFTLKMNIFPSISLETP